MDTILITKNNWQISLDSLNRFKLLNNKTGIVDYFVIHTRYTIDNLYYYVVAYDNPFILPKYIKDLINKQAEQLNNKKENI